MRHLFIKSILLVNVICFQMQVLASKTDSYEPHDEILQFAKAFAKSQITLNTDENLTISTGSIDSRVRLRKCAQSLSAFLPTQLPTKNISLVGVSCEKPVNWKIYVPINVTIESPVIVAAKTIHKNQLIKESDLKIEQRRDNQLHGQYFQNKEAIVGKVAKRFIKQDTILLSSFLDKRQLVNRGQEVLILASVAGLNVKAKGVALTDGVKGDIIRVKNKASERIIEAVVIAYGKVEVRL